MYIIEVIPIERGISIDELSYFSAEKPIIGSLIDITVRKKVIKGLVIRVRDIKEARSLLRTSDFTLKKIEAEVVANASQALTPSYSKTTEYLARFTTSTIGAVIHQTLSKKVLALLTSQKIHIVTPNEFNQKVTSEKKEVSKPYITLFEAHLPERIEKYRSMIEESFSNKHVTEQKSVVILCPTINRATFVFNTLKSATYKKFDGNISFHQLTSKTTSKKLHDAVTTLATPAVYIMTGSFLGLPVSDLGSLIIEDISSEYFITQSRPFIDYSLFAEQLATTYGAHLILSASLISQEQKLRITKHYKNVKEVERTPNTNNNIVGSLITKDQSEKKIFNVLSVELRQILELIQMEKNKHKRLFILSHRRGYAPSIVCSDCGTQVVCKKCEGSVALHTNAKVEGMNSFICHHCGTKRTALEKCKTCDSWRLKPLGIGTELLEEVISKEFPNVTVLKITADTHLADHQKIIKKFLEKEQTVLIGTTLALDYLEQSEVTQAYMAITSFQSMLSIPHLRVREKVVQTIDTLLSLTDKPLLIQSTTQDDSFLKELSKFDYKAFQKVEMKERESLSCPPYCTIITIHVSGKYPTLKSNAEVFAYKLKEYKPVVFPASLKTRKGLSVISLIIKIPAEKWSLQTIDEDLLLILRSFPQNVEIRINPSRLI